MHRKTLAKLFTTILLFWIACTHAAAQDTAFLFQDIADLPCADMSEDAAQAVAGVMGIAAADAACRAVPADLNRDGGPELIFFTAGPGGARVYHILGRSTARWVVLGRLNEQQIYQVGPGSSQGWMDIVARTPGQASPWTRYVWNGTGYAEPGAVDLADPGDTTPDEPGEEQVSHYIVAGDMLYVRRDTATSADVVAVIGHGRCVSSASDPVSADGYDWLILQEFDYATDQGGYARGAAAAKYLAPSPLCEKAHTLFLDFYSATAPAWQPAFEAQCAGAPVERADTAALRDWLGAHIADNPVQYQACDMGAGYHIQETEPLPGDELIALVAASMERKIAAGAQADAYAFCGMPDKAAAARMQLAAMLPLAADEEQNFIKFLDTDETGAPMLLFFENRDTGWRLARIMTVAGECGQ